MKNSSNNHKTQNRFPFAGTALRFTSYFLFVICILLVIWIKWVERFLTVQVPTIDSNLVPVFKTVVPGMPAKLITICTLLLIFALLFLAGAKEKVEDEFITAMRLKAMRFSFMIGILYVILLPVINLFKNNALTDYNGPGLIISMLLMYLISFNILKMRALL